jgi:hypothetical protein
MKDTNQFPLLGGYRVEVTIECTSWTAVMEYMRELFSKPPAQQIAWLIGDDSDDTGDGNSLSGNQEQPPSHHPQFAAFVKVVPRNIYHQICDKAFEIALKLGLFVTGETNAHISDSKLYGIADMYNIIGLNGYDISEK